MIDTRKVVAARRWAIGCVLMVAGIAAAPFARADTVLLAESGRISGMGGDVYSLVAPSAGTLTVKLQNLDFPERLASLSFNLTTATSVLKTLDAAGETTFDLTSAGTYYAIVSGTAQGRWNIGMYSLKISFGPLVAPVPLPGALWLLLSGIAAVLGATRTRMNRALMPAPLAPAPAY
jgi:hypothetical protein